MVQNAWQCHLWWGIMCLGTKIPHSKKQKERSMKKLLTIFLSLCLCLPFVLALSGCSKSTNNKNGSSEKGAGLYQNGKLVKTWAQLVEEFPNAFTKDGGIVGNTNAYMLGQGNVSYLFDISGDLIIDDSIEYIGQFAFYDCTKITSIKFPSSVKTLGMRAFGNGSTLISPSPSALHTIIIDSAEVYSQADFGWTASMNNNANGLLAAATTVYVLKSIVDSSTIKDINGFTKANGSGNYKDYYVFTPAKTK